MLTYKDTAIVFREIPDEVTLAINIAGCPVHCPDCHSKHLWKNDGVVLDLYELDHLIKNNPGITCVSLMGGDNDVQAVHTLLYFVKTNYDLKTSWWSGRENIPDCEFLSALDYLKLGPYIKELGGLDSPKTNQKLYKVVAKDTEVSPVVGFNDDGDEAYLSGRYYELEDITNKLWRNEQSS